MYDRSIKKYDFALQILSHGKQIVRGGFWDGKVAISPVDNEVTIIYPFHHSTVTVIASDDAEKTVVTGAKQGDVIVWSIP